MRILAIGDVHEPWGHRKAKKWLIQFIKQFKPDTVVQVGDLYDLFAYSRFPKAIRVPVEDELVQGRAAAAALWGAVNKAAPKAKLYQLFGNHDERPIKKALSVAPELLPLVGPSLRDLYTFPNVKTVFDPKEELYINDICFMHGYRSRLGDHARYNQGNTVCGHSHTGGVVYQRNRKGVYWELNAGLLGDPEAEVFGYRSQRMNHTCTVGVGVIDELGPRFILYPG